MPTTRFDEALRRRLADVDARGTAKRHEPVMVGVVPPAGERGLRVLLDGEGDRPFLRMNSNGYLGLARHPRVVAAEEAAAARFGAGPGAVRFISGTYGVHRALEERLAAFHGREAAVVFSSAYTAVLGTFAALVTPTTAVVSDELNHSCIINGIRLAQPPVKHVYRHLDLDGLAEGLAVAEGRDTVLVATDGVFSMRGDHAPLDEIAALVAAADERFADGAVLVVDDSHGIGALGATGRGTEEATGARADVLVATLGKALGVNGGYVAGTAALADLLREAAPTYVYSNPITPAEAAAALAAVDVLDGDEGRALLAHLRQVTQRFRAGLSALGFETLPGEHPVVPLLVRDTARTAALVAHLRRHGVLATGLAYPVVPRGDEEIRFQLSADHTPADVDEVLAALAAFRTDT